MPTVQKRGAAVIAARKLSSAMSAAKAACDHMSSWYALSFLVSMVMCDCRWLGTRAGDWVSMGVWSDGSYGAPSGVIFRSQLTNKLIIAVGIKKGLNHKTVCYKLNLGQ